METKKIQNCVKLVMKTICDKHLAKTTLVLAYVTTFKNRSKSITTKFCGYNMVKRNR